MTDRGIIYFWVARMVMMGEWILGREPFSDVYIHGTILDRQGRKMSKSLKNGIDPLSLIEGGTDENTGVNYARPYGADAVRFSLATLSTEGQDLKLWPERFDDGQRFVNKLWNAGRFALAQLAEPAAGPTVDLACASRDLGFEDAWILSRLNAAIAETTAALESFRYCDAAQRVRDFAWTEFCDWYIELVKFRSKAGGADAAACQRVLAYVFDATLRLLHPVCPFITEELWHNLARCPVDRALRQGDPAPSESVIVASWPETDGSRRNAVVEEEFAWLQQIIQCVRKIRQERNLAASKSRRAVVITQDAALADRLRPHAPLVKNLAGLEELEVASGIARPANAAVEVLSRLEVAIPLEAAQPEEEGKAIESQRKKRDELRSYVQREEKKLQNQDFLARAPAAVVEATAKRVDEAKLQLQAIEELLGE